MSTFQGGLSPRAAHTAVYVTETDALYIFGGYDLNNVLGSLQVIQLLPFIFTSKYCVLISDLPFQ